MIVSQISQILIEARTKKNLSVEDVSKAISLRVHVINGLEAGEFEKLGALLYVKSYLRKYAMFLGLDMNQLEDLIRQLQEEKKDLFEHDLIGKINREDGKRLAKKPLFKWYLTAIIFISIAGLIAYFVLSENINDIFNIKPHRTNVLSGSGQYKPAMVLVGSQNPKLSSIVPASEITSFGQAASGMIQVEADRYGTMDQASHIVFASKIEKILARVEKNNMLVAANTKNEQPVQDEEDTEIMSLEEGSSQLSITVTDICWVQVVDQDNKIVISENLSPNQIYHLIGVPPFKARFGNAQAISDIVIDGYQVNPKLYKPNSRATVISFTITPEEAKQYHQTR